MLDHGHDHENEVIAFGETNFRGQPRRFGIKTDDRRRHMYVLGKTGMGKSNMLENLIIRDIYAGHGVGVIDPHGELVEKVLDFIPPDRINDVVYFNPADIENPIGFNVLEAIDESHKNLVAAGLMAVFKKIWPDVWSARMEYIMNNCLLALMDYPGSTLMGINRLFVDKEYRHRVVAKIKDPVVKSFWVTEFANYEPKFRTEAVAPIQNKVGQFLSSVMMRNIVAQVKSTIDTREIMDNGKIFLMNMSKGRIGEDASRLLGGLLITKIQLSAMSRVDIPEVDRRDFYLYVDEFQNFASKNFADILSEARKYRLSLIMAHQYIEQLDEDMRPAVFGNVGTMVVFRIGGADALFVVKEFEPHFTEVDLVNLPKYNVYLKLMIDGVSSQPFSATTLPPITERTHVVDKVIKVSRERWAMPRAVIEEKILRWSQPNEGAETPPGEVATQPEQNSPGVPYGLPTQRPPAEPLPKGKWATPSRRPDNERFLRPPKDQEPPKVVAKELPSVNRDLQTTHYSLPTQSPPRPQVKFKTTEPPPRRPSPASFSMKEGSLHVKETEARASLKGLMRKKEDIDEDDGEEVEVKHHPNSSADEPTGGRATGSPTVFSDTPTHSKPKHLRPGEKAKLP